MIWIVVEGYQWESETIIGVFNDPGRAEEFADRKRDENHTHYPWKHREYYTHIQSWEIQ